MKQKLILLSEMMDETFFEKALRRGLGDETITNVTIKSKKPAIRKGENFLSMLWRFELEYCCAGTNEESGQLMKKDITLIAKQEPDEDGPGSALIRDQNIFTTELRMLEMVLPNIEKLVGQRLSPKYFYGLQDSSIIVMEDLTPLGFKTKDRQRGLSMNYILKTIDSLAKFHAGSVKLCEQNPDIIKSFMEGMMSKNTPKNMFRMVENTLNVVIKRIRTWPNPIYLQIAEKLEVLVQKFAEDVIKVTKYDDDEFCVLNHGDCWVNNILFRENPEQDEPLEVMLVDYQMSIYSSPAVDLIHFLAVCPELDLACDKDDFFIEEYLRKLSKMMILLECKTKPPTFNEIQKAMLKRRMLVVQTAIAYHPRMLVDSDEVETFDELLLSGETKMDIFKNPIATDFLKKILPYLNRRGYFD